MKCPVCSFETDVAMPSLTDQCPNCNLVYAKHNPDAKFELHKLITAKSTKKTQKTKWAPFGHSPLFVFSLCSIVFLGAWGYGSYTAKSDKSSYERVPIIDKSTAQYACENFVKNNLKSPSTAAFPPITEMQIESDINNIWTVNSYVDAQNSFSAMIRSQFSCQIKIEGANAKLLNLRIE